MSLCVNFSQPQKIQLNVSYGKNLRILVAILFPMYGCFLSIRFQFCAILHYVRNVQVSLSKFHNIRKCSKTHLMGRAQKIVVNFFQKVCVLPWYYLVYFFTCETNGCSNQYPITCKFVAKLILQGEPGILIPIFCLKYGCLSSIKFLSYDELQHMGNAWIFP